jgi:nucleotide-binding universal stress UspA family protein
VLVVAIDPVVPEGLAHADVLVVAPALNSWLRHWLSDEDPARRRAEERLDAVVGQLQRTLVHVEGRVGDADPLQAAADALATFPADEIVISARPERSIDQIDDLVSRVRERFALPVFLGPGLSQPIAA